MDELLQIDLAIRIGFLRPGTCRNKALAHLRDHFGVDKHICEIILVSTSTFVVVCGQKNAARPGLGVSVCWH